MFDLKSYCEACNKLTLDAEKIEEMITMTETTGKKPVRRPTRVVLVAAALAAALGITASAAEIPAVREFFATVFVTVNTDDGMLAGMNIPTMAVEKRDGRTILILNDEEIDVTDAIADGGKYLYEGAGYTVRVDANGEACLTASYGDYGETISFTTKPGVRDEKVVYNVIADSDDQIRTGVYEVTASEQSGAVSVTAEDGQIYDYQWDGMQFVPVE